MKKYSQKTMSALIVLALSGMMAASVYAEDTTKDNVSANNTTQNVTGNGSDTLAVNGSSNNVSGAKGVIYADQNGTVQISDWDTVKVTPSTGFGIHVGGTGDNSVTIQDVKNISISSATESFYALRNEGGSISVNADTVSLAGNRFSIYAGNTIGSTNDTNTTTIKSTGNVQLHGGVKISGGLTKDATSSVAIEGNNVELNAVNGKAVLDVSGKEVGGKALFSTKATNDLTVNGEVSLATNSDDVQASFVGKNVTFTNSSGAAIQVQNRSTGTDRENAQLDIQGENISIAGTKGALASYNGAISIDQSGENGSVNIQGTILTTAKGTTNLSAEGDTSASTGAFSTSKGGTVNFNKGTWDIHQWSGTDGNIAIQSGATANVNTNITVTTAKLADGSTTIIDASKMNDKPVITVTDADNSSIGDKATIQVNNFKVGDTLTLVDTKEENQKDAASALNAIAAKNAVSDNLMQGFTVNTDGSIQIQAADAKKVLANTVLQNVITQAVDDTKFASFLKNTDAATAEKRLNAVANMAELGGAAHSTYTVSGLLTDAILQHAKTTTADIWAQPFHSKESVNGLGLAGTTASYDGQYNGLIIGSDFSQNEHTTIGAAFLYGDGNISGTNDVSYTKNDATFWGGSLYGTKKLSSYSLGGDISYVSGSHDIRQLNGDTTITAKPDTEAWSIGATAWKDIAISENATLTPYAGLRYMRLITDAYTTNLGIHYDKATQDIVILPVGINYKASFQRNNWNISPYMGVGYLWNLGDTDARTTAAYGTGVDALTFTTVDNNSVVLRAGLTAETGSTSIGIGYTWQDGNTTTNQTWQFHAGYKF